MANIFTLKRSITEMPPGEALSVIRTCRDSRRIAKANAKRKRMTVNKKRVIDPFSMVHNLSDAQKQLVKQMILGDS